MAVCRASTASPQTPHKQVRQWQNKHHMTLGHMGTQSQMKDNKAPLVCKHQCLYAESQGPVDTHVNSVKLSGVVHTSTHEQGEFTSHPSPRSTTALALCCYSGWKSLQGFMWGGRHLLVDPLEKCPRKLCYATHASHLHVVCHDTIMSPLQQFPKGLHDLLNCFQVLRVARQ